MHEIRAAAAAIAKQSQHVRIDTDGLNRLAVDLLHVVPPTWLRSRLNDVPAIEQDPIHFFDGSERTVAYVLLLDAINFCFWPEEFTVIFRDIEFGADSKYRAVAAALTRAFEAGEPLWDPKYLQQLTFDDLRRIFLTNKGQVPLLVERLANLHNVGRVLETRFSGRAMQIFEECNYFAPDIARLVAREFEAYRDERNYHGLYFPVLKRAQLFVSDTALFFGNQGFGKLTGLEELTCFADYRLPQFMRAKGALVYSEELDRKIATKEVIIKNSDEEIEIRANTIHTVELLCERLSVNGIKRTAREIDYLIWEERVRLGEFTVPHHRTLTTSY